MPDDYKKQVGDIYLVKGSSTNAVTVIHGNTNIGTLYYQVDGENLSGGDIIELSISQSIWASSNVIKKLEDLGYVIPTTYKNITVTDLGEYLKNEDQLTPEILTAIKNEIYTEAEIEKN